MCSTSPNQNQFEEILENSDLPSCSQSFFIGRDFTSIRSIEIGFSCEESSTTLQKVFFYIVNSNCEYLNIRLKTYTNELI